MSEPTSVGKVSVNLSEALKIAAYVAGGLVFLKILTQVEDWVEDIKYIAKKGAGVVEKVGSAIYDIHAKSEEVADQLAGEFLVSGVQGGNPASVFWISMADDVRAIGWGATGGAISTIGNIVLEFAKSSRSVAISNVPGHVVSGMRVAGVAALGGVAVSQAMNFGKFIANSTAVEVIETGITGVSGWAIAELIHVPDFVFLSLFNLLVSAPETLNLAGGDMTGAQIDIDIRAHLEEYPDWVVAAFRSGPVMGSLVSKAIMRWGGVMTRTGMGHSGMRFSGFRTVAVYTIRIASGIIVGSVLSIFGNMVVVYESKFFNYVSSVMADFMWKGYEIKPLLPATTDEIKGTGWGVFAIGLNMVGLVSLVRLARIRTIG